MKKKPSSSAQLPSVSHDTLLIDRLKRDPEFAAIYLKTAIEEAFDADGRRVLLAAIRQVVEAHGIAKIARVVGMKRESLSRALSAKGNPRFDTLYSVVHAVGLQLTIKPMRRKIHA